MRRLYRTPLLVWLLSYLVYFVSFGKCGANDVTAETPQQTSQFYNFIKALLQNGNDKAVIKNDDDLNDDTQEMKKNEYGNYYEGDMVLDSSVTTRGRPMTVRYWPGGVIPFDFDRRFSSDDRKKILNVINHLNQNTCLQ